MDAQVVTIRVKIDRPNGASLDLSTKEAREIFEKLKDVFGTPPDAPPVQWWYPPNYQPTPYNPPIYGGGAIC